MLGETRLMPQLEERLLGSVRFAEEEVSPEMPPDYPDEALRGKRVLYEVEVVSVSEPELPDLDEEFIGKLGVESGSMDDLRSNVRLTLERELRQVCEDHKRRALLDQLLDANPGPGAEVAGGSGSRTGPRGAARSASASPLDPEAGEEAEEPPELPEETPELRAAAEQRVRLQLLVSELAAREEITPDPAEAQRAVADAGFGSARPGGGDAGAGRQPRADRQSARQAAR